LNKAVDSYWADDRLSAQRVVSRTIPTFAPVRDLSREIVGSPTEIRRRGGLIPSWVLFGMIIAATFALCVSVTMRTRAELRMASTQYDKMRSDVEQLQESNATLRTDLQRLRTDPRAIESAARERLSMVRPNEIVIPLR
jgi:cell division protein FtsB